MGIGPFIGGVWLILALTAMAIYIFRFRYRTRIMWTTLSFAALVAPLLTLLAAVAFIPELMFDQNNSVIRGLFLLSMMMMPFAFIGVVFFSSLERRKAKTLDAEPRNDVP